MIKTIISAESNMSSLFQQNVGSRYIFPCMAWPHTFIPWTNHMTRHYDYSGLQVLLLWVVWLWHPPWLPLEALAHRGQHLPQSSQVTSNTLSSSSFSFLTSCSLFYVNYSKLLLPWLGCQVSPCHRGVQHGALSHSKQVRTENHDLLFLISTPFLAQGWDWRSKRRLLNRWATRIWQGEITFAFSQTKCW